jgi:hypothetical protein
MTEPAALWGPSPAGAKELAGVAPTLSSWHSRR